MPSSPRRSLQHEYELFVQNEIEAYKESLTRSAILKLGDEAVSELGDQAQLELTELVVWDQVDKLITKRLRLPSYATWKRRRLKSQKELQRPEHWGIAPDGAVARDVHPPPDSEILVTGDAERAACFLAAHGYNVYAVAPSVAAVEKIVEAANAAGLIDHVRGGIGELRHLDADVELGAVVCGADAFDGMSEDERRETIDVLQERTRDGGVHVVSVANDGDKQKLGELSEQYRGWQVRMQEENGVIANLVARKGEVRRAG